MVTTSTLASLAILKVNIDEKDSDYVDYLTSFVVDVLNRNKPDVVTDELVSEFLLSEHGLNVPRKGAQMVLRRLAKKKYITKEHGTFLLTERLPDIDLSGKKEDLTKIVENVCKELQSYALEKKNRKWNDTASTDALLSFFDQFGVDYLRAYIFRTALPSIGKSDKSEHFITASFIRDHYDAGDEIFDNVILLLKGHMLANALVCPDLESIQKEFGRVVFFLDTPLILSVLKLQGPEEYSSMTELLSLVHNLKGTICVFEHTIDEVRGVLTAAEVNFDNPKAEGAVIREIRKSDKKKSDLVLLRENLEDYLRNLNVCIKDSPRYEKDFQIGEADLRSALEQRVHYRNERALDHDVNSVRSIYVLRHGLVPRRLEDSQAVFVTPNSSLAAASYEYGKSHNSTREVSAAITDYSLANVAWLKAPLGAPDLPKKELLAACYAAMEPDDLLWSKFVGEMDRLKDGGGISSDDHALLRVSPMATKELMNLTLGSDEDLTGATVKEVLERVKSDLTKQKDNELAEQQKKQKRLAEERDALIDEKEKRNAAVYWRSTRLAAKFTQVIRVVAFIILLAAAFSSPLLTTSYISGSAIMTGLLNGVLVVGLIWGFLNWYWGVSVKSVSELLQKTLQTKIYRFLNALTHSSESE